MNNQINENQMKLVNVNVINSKFLEVQNKIQTKKTT